MTGRVLPTTFQESSASEGATARRPTRTAVIGTAFLLLHIAALALALTWF